MAGSMTFAHFEDLHSGFPGMLVERAKDMGAEAVAELGGGARPLIEDEDTWGFVPRRVVYDIDPGELAKACDRLDKRQADLCEPLGADAPDAGSYDLVFSHALCEHLREPEVFHRNCHHLLRPGGVAVHYFPTLGALPFVVNRLVPEKAARRLLGLAHPNRMTDPKRGKFPAYYRWCGGPTARSMGRFELIGFEVEEWRAGFGHNYYKRLGSLQAFEDAKADWLARHAVRRLSSFAAIVLRKPE
jgi:SAM-dependent methyltransferase